MVTETGVAYALLAGITWGVVLYARKRYFADVHSATFMSLTFGCAALWYAPVSLAGTFGGGGDGAVAATAPATGSATPTTGAATTTGAAVSAVDAGAVLATIALLALGLYLLFQAIDAGDVSYVAPVAKITPVFVVPIEVVLLAEFLTPLQVAGVVVVTAAVYLANYEAGGLLEPLRRAVTYRPGQLAIASALVLALLNVSQRVVLQELAVVPTTWIGVKLAGTALLLAPLGWRRVDPAALRPRTIAPRVLALGAVLAVGEHCIGQAFALVSASVASPMVSVQSIVAVLLGGFLLGEGHLRLRLGAAVTAVAGIALVALP